MLISCNNITYLIDYIIYRDVYIEHGTIFHIFLYDNNIFDQLTK